MRVLIINSVPDFASTGRICAAIGRSLFSLGHDVMIAFGRGKALTDFGEKHGIRIGNVVDLYVHGIKSRLFDAQGLGSKAATIRFLKKAEEFDPDIIWLNNLHGYYVNIKLLFEWIKSRRSTIFWTLHDCWAFTGHCCYYDFNHCDGWLHNCDSCSFKGSYPRSFISRSKSNYLLKESLFSCINNLTLITPSLWLKEEVSKSFLKNYDCKIINNGIDLSAFYPEKRGTSNDGKKVILGVANKWITEKGLNDFIKLSSLIKQDEKIVLVGKIQKGLVIPSNITTISRTNSLDELRRIYSKADVFFNPTYQDNYPTVNMEAIACHTPVVSYDVGGACEMIDHRFAVENGNVSMAYELMEKIMSGQVHYDFSMRDSFSNTAFIQKYLNLFLKTK